MRIKHSSLEGEHSLSLLIADPRSLDGFLAMESLAFRCVPLSIPHQQEQVTYEGSAPVISGDFSEALFSESLKPDSCSLIALLRISSLGCL